MRMKIAPQVTQLLTREESLESNSALVQMWHEIQREQGVEPQTAQRAKLGVDARPAPQRVRFNHD
jgi:hypothetical protein